MIQRIYDPQQLGGLHFGVESGKLLALYKAYGGGYDFCRFFRQSGKGEAYIAALDGSFVLAEADGADFPELAQFLSMHGFSEIFCSKTAGEGLKRFLRGEFHRVRFMERTGGNNGALPREVAPSQAWEIIGSRFEISFEPWYLDMSHRVRHGISRCFSDGNAAVVLQHEINGEALLSQVCVRRELEGQGYAGKLLNAVCKALSGKVQVICEEELVVFYEKCGFHAASDKYVISRD